MAKEAHPLTLDRRGFLRLGLTATATLATVGLAGSLAGCGARDAAAAQGYAVLRDADIALLRALSPVVLQGLTLESAAIDEVLRNIDSLLSQAQPPARKTLFQLFDLLHLRPTRWATTGISAPWDEASAGEIKAFLDRWRSSSIGLLNAGYRGLVKLCGVGYYGGSQGPRAAGYPGPWAPMHAVVNS